MLRRFLPLTGAALASLSVLFADANGSYSSAQSSNPNEMDPCCQSRKQITPPCQCIGECAIGVNINADYILWTARQAGLEYVAESTTQATGGVATLAQGSIGQPSFNLRSGFKVGAGVQTDHDNFDVNVQYTWFQSKTGGNLIAEAASNTNVQPMWNTTGGSTAASYVSEANETWQLKFNAIDGMLGRCFWISEWLQLRPALGIKGAWNRQNLNVSYLNAAQTSWSFMQSTLRFRGAGIRFELDNNWYMNRCWSIQGLFAGSAIYGKYTNNVVTGSAAGSTTNVPTTPTSFYQNTTNNFYNVVPVFEYSLGLQWETWFGDMNEYRFLIKAAWEEQIWGSQNMFNTLGRGNHSDLGLQGLTLHFRFDF